MAVARQRTSSWFALADESCRRSPTPTAVAHGRYQPESSYLLKAVVIPTRTDHEAIKLAGCKHFSSSGCDDERSRLCRARRPGLRDLPRGLLGPRTQSLLARERLARLRRRRPSLSLTGPGDRPAAAGRLLRRERRSPCGERLFSGSSHGKDAAPVSPGQGPRACRPDPEACRS